MSEILESRYLGERYAGYVPEYRRPSTWLERMIERAKSGVFTISTMLTPEIAQALLDNNPNNRPISEKKSEEYARDIASGRWMHNGESVIVANTGELNDGQHRCRAVIIAGKPIVTQMTFGVERDTRTTVDIGVKRTSAQHLGMNGHAHYVQLSRAIATVLTFKKVGRLTAAPENRPTSSEIIEWASSHPEMQDSVSAGLSIYRHLRASAGLFAGLHYLFAEKSRVDADAFFEALGSGEMMGKGDPIYELRQSLVRHRASKAKLPENEIAARAIKAWNRYRVGKRVGVLRMITKGRGKEQFPMPE